MFGLLLAAPPRGLEEDEVTFLEEVQERRNMRERMTHEQEEQDKAAFRASRAPRTALLVQCQVGWVKRVPGVCC